MSNGNLPVSGVATVPDLLHSRASAYMPKLPDGNYPFIDERFPLAEMVIVEAPSALEALFKKESAANGVAIVRGEPIELRCRSEEYPDATFLIFWPHGENRIHMLVPKRFAQGRA